MKWLEIQTLLNEMQDVHLCAEQIRCQVPVMGAIVGSEADAYVREHAPYTAEDALEALEEVPDMLLATWRKGYNEGFADGAAGKNTR